MKNHFLVNKKNICFYNKNKFKGLLTKNIFILTNTEDFNLYNIDNVFIWSGNSGVFPAIMKYIEDKENVARDTNQADVRSIIIVEDTPRYYSSILPILYKIILYHTQQLITKVRIKFIMH